MKKTSLFALLLVSIHLQAQDPTAPYFKLTREGFKENNAYQTTAFVEKRWRLPGNKGFNESIYEVEKVLKAAGFVKEANNEQEAPLTYRVERRPLKQKTWEPVDANVMIVGQNEPLLQFKTNRNMLAIGSSSTIDGGVTADVLYLSKVVPANLKDEDLKDKIVFSETGVGRLFSLATNAGAFGVLGYSMPNYTQPEKHQTSIQFSGINNPEGKGWAINLSYQAKERLKKALANGPVKLRVIVKTQSYKAEELTIVANVRGTIKPNERLVYSAHVQEPGANDNATGVGTLAEMARLTAELVNAGKLKPQRTLTFLWGDEITSTRRYITEDQERAKGILWGMSLDMVGEDTKKTGGTFLIEKMPDPSAIWTRGNDKHSEWGAGHVEEKDLFPHYYNDFIMMVCNAQGKQANWKVNFNPFEGGSDHTPFLQNKIPGLLMWHFTDVFYHTDNDRLDKVSATTMRNVGISALTAGYTLINADEETAISIITAVKEAALKRLATEFELSKKEIGTGKPADREQLIMTTWGKWYIDALASTSLIPINKETTKVGSAIKFAVNQVEQQYNKYLKELR